MNRTETDIYIEKRLRHWASWYARLFHCAVGFCNKNILQEIREYGGIYVRGTTKFVFPTNDEAEEIEHFITIMGNQNKIMASALRQHYLGEGSIKEKANYIGLQETTFRQYVKMGRQWLAGRLSTESN